MNITRLADENTHKLNMPIIRETHVQIKTKNKTKSKHYSIGLIVGLLLLKVFWSLWHCNIGAIPNKAHAQNQNKR
ncbi:hypothetical protein EUGRSUZ_D02361 [Eucalyptus grandis]|uniref:Uncharacterized protein n=2 Tax=Eucalyptus grandis TaxID=71139 RepID=A0A059CIU6_EUCGR|nr:hypothetical protein EUGRSUZ_D02361 [Eucalyptus grandis]